MTNQHTNISRRFHSTPGEVIRMKIHIANTRSKMSQRRVIRVREGEASFLTEANSFITLLVDGESSFEDRDLTNRLFPDQLFFNIFIQFIGFDMVCQILTNDLYLV
jgi:hypothetical protein